MSMTAIGVETGLERHELTRYYEQTGDIYKSIELAKEAGVIAYNTVMLYFESRTATISSFTEETKVIDF